MRHLSRALVAGLALLTVPAWAQDAPPRSGGPGGRGTPVRSDDVLRELERALAVVGRVSASTPVVREAPYSGEGITTTVQTLSDGTRIERTTRTRVWRDRMGRVRREQTAVGLGPLSPGDDAVTTITIEDPVTGQVHTLNPERQTARSSRTGLAAARLGSNRPNGSESLGTREIEGVKAIGWRMTRTIPAGQIGNDRPIVTTDEQWESPELRVLVLSRQHDPRTGTVEYRLTNIDRSEPPPDLFMIPANYTTTPAPALESGRGRGVGGGGGARGRSNAIDGLAPPSQVSPLQP